MFGVKNNTYKTILTLTPPPPSSKFHDFLHGKKEGETVEC